MDCTYSFRTRERYLVEVHGIIGRKLTKAEALDALEGLLRDEGRHVGPKKDSGSDKLRAYQKIEAQRREMHRELDLQRAYHEAQRRLDPHAEFLKEAMTFWQKPILLTEDHAANLKRIAELEAKVKELERQIEHRAHIDLSCGKCGNAFRELDEIYAYCRDCRPRPHLAKDGVGIETGLPRLPIPDDDTEDCPKHPGAAHALVGGAWECEECILGGGIKLTAGKHCPHCGQTFAWLRTQGAVSCRRIEDKEKWLAAVEITHHCPLAGVAEAYVGGPPGGAEVGGAREPVPANAAAERDGGERPSSSCQCGAAATREPHAHYCPLHGGA